jgi:hypothetical protein
MQTEITTIGQLIVPKGVVNLQDVNINLMEMMIMVKQNPRMIDQAKSMCEIADRVVDVAKTQVLQANMIVELNRMKQGL